MLACVRKRNQGSEIAEYAGGPGKLTCSWDLTITGGAQMGSFGGGFERLK